MASTKKFDHLDSTFFQFLEELKLHNNMGWLHENRAQYKKRVVYPLLDFIIVVDAPLKIISDHYVVDPRTHRESIFRIYRDVRFSKDKTPYKDHSACQFRHEGSKAK